MVIRQPAEWKFKEHVKQVAPLTPIKYNYNSVLINKNSWFSTKIFNRSTDSIIYRFFNKQNYKINQKFNIFTIYYKPKEHKITDIILYENDKKHVKMSNNRIPEKETSFHVHTTPSKSVEDIEKSANGQENNQNPDERYLEAVKVPENQKNVLNSHNISTNTSVLTASPYPKSNISTLNSPVISNDRNKSRFSKQQPIFGLENKSTQCCNNMWNTTGIIQGQEVILYNNTGTGNDSITPEEMKLSELWKLQFQRWWGWSFGRKRDLCPENDVSLKKVTNNYSENSKFNQTEDQFTNNCYKKMENVSQPPQKCFCNNKNQNVEYNQYRSPQTMYNHSQCVEQYPINQHTYPDPRTDRRCIHPPKYQMPPNYNDRLYQENTNCGSPIGGQNWYSPKPPKARLMKRLFYCMKPFDDDVPIYTANFPPPMQEPCNCQQYYREPCNYRENYRGNTDIFKGWRQKNSNTSFCSVDNDCCNRRKHHSTTNSVVYSYKVSSECGCCCCCCCCCCSEEDVTKQNVVCAQTESCMCCERNCQTDPENNRCKCCCKCCCKKNKHKKNLNRSKNSSDNRHMKSHRECNNNNCKTHTVIIKSNSTQYVGDSKETATATNTANENYQKTPIATITNYPVLHNAIFNSPISGKKFDIVPKVIHVKDKIFDMNIPKPLGINELLDYSKISIPTSGNGCDHKSLLSAVTDVIASCRQADRKTKQNKQFKCESIEEYFDLRSQVTDNGFQELHSPTNMSNTVKVAGEETLDNDQSQKINLLLGQSPLGDFETVLKKYKIIKSIIDSTETKMQIDQTMSAHINMDKQDLLVNLNVEKADNQTESIKLNELLSDHILKNVEIESNLVHQQHPHSDSHPDFIDLLNVPSKSLKNSNTMKPPQCQSHAASCSQKLSNQFQ